MGRCAVHVRSRFFDREGNLWAGGEAGQIYRIDNSGKVETIANVGGFLAIIVGWGVATSILTAYRPEPA